MTHDFKYPAQCPLARDLFEALSIWSDELDEDLEDLIRDAAQTLERQHHMLKFFHDTFKGEKAQGNA